MANMAWKSEIGFCSGGIKGLLSPRDVRLLSKDNKNQGTYPSSFQSVGFRWRVFLSQSLPRGEKGQRS